MRSRITPTHLTPFEGLSLMDDALRTFRALRDPGFLRATSAWTGTPDARVETTEEGWTVRADLPGTKPEDLEIEAEGDILRVRVKRTEDVPDGFRALHRERSAIHMERSFTFGRGFDLDRVTAKLEDGVLTVSVPKRPDPERRAIAVTHGS